MQKIYKLFFGLICLLSFKNNADCQSTALTKYPSLKIQYPDTLLRNLEEKYLLRKDTLGLIYVYGGYLISETAEQTNVTKSLFFFIENKRILDRLPLQDKLRLRLSFLIYYWGGSTDLVFQKVKEIEDIIAISRENKWNDLKLEAFHIKYYLLSGKNYLYKYPKEVEDFYEENKEVTKQNKLEAVTLNVLMGRYALQQKNYTKAFECFQQVKVASKQIGNIQYEHVSMLFIAQVYRLMGKTQEGLKNALEIIEILKNKNNIHAIDLKRWAHEEAAKMYGQIGNYKVAHTHWSKYDTAIRQLVELGGSNPEGQPSFLEKLEDEAAKQAEEKRLQQTLLAESEKNNKLLIFLFFTLLALFIGVLATGLFWVHQNRVRTKKENDYKILMTQEAEREKISQELHDYVGNSLIAIKNALPQTNLKIQNLLSDVYGIIRTASHSLSSAAIAEVGLAESCQDFIELIDSRRRIIPIFHGEEPPMELIKLQTTFRIIQELLGNALKHSLSETIRFALYFKADELLINVEDTGVGFDKDNIRSGNGLSNIKNRLKLIEGTLEIDTKPNKGTSIWVNIPT